MGVSKFNIFNYRNEDGYKICNFDNTNGHRKLPDNDWGV